MNLSYRLRSLDGEADILSYGLFKNSGVAQEHSSYVQPQSDFVPTRLMEYKVTKNRFVSVKQGVVI